MGTRNENIITVVDLGSAKTIALVVETTEAGLRYRGHGIAPSGGTKRGVVVDLEQAGKSVSDAVALAEKSCGLSLESAVVVTDASLLESCSSTPDSGNDESPGASSLESTGDLAPHPQASGSPKTAQCSGRSSRRVMAGSHRE